MRASLLGSKQREEGRVEGRRNETGKEHLLKEQKGKGVSKEGGRLKESYKTRLTLL